MANEGELSGRAARLAILRKAEVFKELDSSALEALDEAMQRQCFEPDETFIHAGRGNATLVLVVSGEAVVQLANAAEQFVVRAGTLIGELQILTGQRTATVTSKTRLEVLTLDAADFHRIAEAHPEVRRRVLSLIRERRLTNKLIRSIRGNFGSSSAALRDEVLDSVEWVKLEKGEFLLRKGDPSDAMFFALTGRLEAVVDDGEGAFRKLREIYPGQSFGETALLEEGSRSAYIWATRPSDVARIPRERYLDISRRYPAVLRSAVKVMVGRMDAGPVSVRRGSTVAIVPISRQVPLSEVVEALVEALQVNGPVEAIRRQAIADRFNDPALADIDDSASDALILRLWLEHKDVGEQTLLLVADDMGSGWARRCVRMADDVVLVSTDLDSQRLGSDEAALPFRTRLGAGPRVSLLLLHNRPGPWRETGRWLDPRPLVEDVYHVRRRSEADYARVGRLLSGRGVGVVLGGGAARGYAGIGMLRAFEDLGIPIDAIGGVSAGAIIAAMYASSGTTRDLLPTVQRMIKLVPDLTLPSIALQKGATAVAAFQESVGEGLHIEDFPIPCLFVSSNLSRAEQRVSRRGAAGLELAASNALPPIMPPILIDGDLHVDGAFLNNVPIDEVKALARFGRTVALDVNPDVAFERNIDFTNGVSGVRVAFDKLRKKGKYRAVPNLFEILLRSQMLVHVRHVRDRRPHASLYLQPALTGFRVSDFKRIDAIQRSGYAECIEAIRSWWETEQSGVGAEPPNEP